MIIYSDQEQDAGPFYFLEYEGFKLCRSASNVPTSGSVEYQLRLTIYGMDWMDYIINMVATH